jgi:uncharacterized protein
VEKADKKIDEIKRDYKRDLLIETFSKIPDAHKAEYKDGEKKRFFRTWAENRYKDQNVAGIYVLICTNPKSLYVLAGKETQKKAFTPKNEDALSEQLLADLKASKPDKALLDGVNYVGQTLEHNIGKGSRSSSAAPTNPVSQHKGDSPMSGIWGWICIGLVVLLAVWLLFGVIRALTGGGGGRSYGPGPGPGGGGYGGGYGGGGGGGGGGFLSSLVGGMFGAAAGMWMYDSFFRGGSSGGAFGSSAGAGGSPAAGADDRTPGDAGAGGDWGNDGGGGGGAGGDWGGGDAGGGDAGGGGDWGGGGGGDAGGGGDWGGGGGDVGGGGGGDWGGGGGGGDFGGGGGGGDW